MEKTFDQIIKDNKNVLSEAYFGFSSLIEHHSKMDLSSAVKNIDGKRVSLTIQPGKSVERLMVDEKTIHQISKEQFTLQFKNLFFQTFIYSAQPEDFKSFLNDLPRTIDAFLNDFKNPIFFSNSRSQDWGTWNSVTHNMKDMLLVCMDAQHIRYVLGINGD